jgi:NAD(P)-dependent dehydrogenase (short-subunit alcohol dehydrogenase family)
LSFQLQAFKENITANKIKKRLMKRIILITGSNRGLGNATGLKLCELGHEVIFTSRNLKSLDETKAKVHDKGYTAGFYELDVKDKKSIQNLKTEIEKKYDHLDTLINNAGILNDRNDSILDVDQTLVKDTMNTNLYSPLFMIQNFKDLIKKSTNGIIVNISSVLGQLENMTTGMPSYRISKCALNAITKVASEELKAFNVKVNSIHPGWVRTDMGGSEASLSIDESVPGLVWAATLDQDGPTGKFFFNQKEIPW